MVDAATLARLREEYESALAALRQAAQTYASALAGRDLTLAESLGALANAPRQGWD